MEQAYINLTLSNVTNKRKVKGSIDILLWDICEVTEAKFTGYITVDEIAVFTTMLKKYSDFDMFIGAENFNERIISVQGVEETFRCDAEGNPFLTFEHIRSLMDDDCLIAMLDSFQGFAE